MEPRPVLLVALLLVSALAGCLDAPGSSEDPGGDDDAAVTTVCQDQPPTGDRGDQTTGTVAATINTTEGDIEIELFHERAPITVANFVQYAQEGFYEGTIVHRVIPDFVIQAGGFTPNVTKKPTRDRIPLERHPELENTRGTLSMARTQRPNSATSQFFVNLADNTDSLGRGAGYAVFGEVVQGMDVVDRIANVSTHEEEGHKNVPEEDIVVRSVEVDPPESDGDPLVRAAAFRDVVRPPTDAPAQVPFQVANDWDAERRVSVEVDGDATDLTIPGVNGTSVTLTPGASALVVATVPAGTNGTAAVVAEAGGVRDRAETDVRPNEGVGNAVSTDKYRRVKVCYTGMLETGAPFGSNDPALDARESLRILPGMGEPAEPLKIWAGDGKPGNSNYTKVITGFRDSLLGLKQGQTNLRRVTPDEGYQDGVDRWFWVGVEGVRSR
jgi:cyclophilin family peptidyl-prolyl cis-trans isomerase